MKVLLRHLALFFGSLGGFGLLFLGVLDSSFLFLPLGNDLLIVALAARHHERMLYYAGMATLGSVIGCFLTDWVCRKGGEEGLKKRLSPRQLKFVKGKVEKRGGFALAVASILPPPFPFTPFVIAAAAMQYPRRKLLSVIAVSRLIRFCIEGTLAVVFGRRILQLMESPMVQDSMIVLVIVSIVGSVWSVWSWLRKSESKAGNSKPVTEA